MRLPSLFSIAIAFAGLMHFQGAYAQNIQTARVEFAGGSDGATIPGTIKGDRIVDYVVRAEAGQTMSVDMTVDNPSAYFNVTAPGAAAAMHIGSTAGNKFVTEIPSTGDYVVRVYMMRSAARRNETASYRIEFRITDGDTAAMPPPKTDYADGLSGGPDYWEVTGVSSGDRLNMRQGPSTSNRVTATLANGTVLRNLGCRMSGNQRWCNVEMLQDGGWAGWVAGRYLREAAAPSSGAASAGGRFDAKGSIPCAISYSAPMGSCDFGVVRKGTGTAIVTVFLPGGGTRILHFQSGEPSMVEGADKMTWDRRGDLILLEVDNAQRFEVVDAVIFGG